jgi:hypothetical protein
MRSLAAFLILLALVLASCSDDGPAAPGGLVVRTSTTGNHPDPDGYLLSVDGTQSLPLAATDSVRTDLPAGRHSLRLIGVADHCLVEPDLSVDAVVEPGAVATVAFEIACEATGAEVTVLTTGVDFDPDGYSMVVNGVGVARVLPNHTILALLGAGSHTVVIQGLHGNCAMDGASSRTVTVEVGELVPVSFTVVCRATTGVIGVLLAQGDDVEGPFEAWVGGGGPFDLVPGTPVYFPGKQPGEYVVSIVGPGHCSTEDAEQSVTVVVGGVVRDTADVVFRARCDPTRFRITAPTEGPAGDAEYTVWECQLDGWYCYYNGPSLVGSLRPNGTLLVPAVPNGNYGIELRDVPGRCDVQGGNSIFPSPPAPGDTVDVVFMVTCPS